MSPLTRLLPLLAVSAPVLAQSVDDPRLLVETWIGGLTRPVSATFVGPGDLLVFQNTNGKVLRIVDGNPANEALDLTVSFQGARGMVTDPDFASNGYVYLYYGVSSVADGGPWEESRVERYTFDGTNLVDPFGPLFVVPFDAAQSNVNTYNAGYLRFGPDGMLYGQVGDKARGRVGNERIEENTGAGASSLAGGIFRISKTGAIPADNPFLGEADPGVHPWVVYGFRNSLGLDFDPVSGDLWFSDNSVGDYDEVNRGSFGMNSGWLKIMGPDARDVVYPLNGDVPWDAADLVYLAGAFYRDPELSYKAANGVTTVTFLASRRFPEDLWDDLLVGDVNFGQLYRYDLVPARDALALTGGLADRVADSDAERDADRWASGLGTITDALIGPDGHLYVVSWDKGAVFRVRPKADLFEPASIGVPGGSLVSGGADELLSSDDARVVLGPGARGGWFERRVLEATVFLSHPAPVRLDVQVEAHAGVAGVLQTIELFHVPTSSWFTLDRRTIGEVDETVLVEDVPFPSEHVDPATNQVRIRVRQLAPDRPAALVGGSPAPNPFTTEVDLIRVLATRP